jgi:hypothetical protein
VGPSLWDGRGVKAISLWQPWASAIAAGGKCWETRSWYIRYRGVLAIHAAMKTSTELRALRAEEPFLTTLRGLGELPFGAIVAVAYLGDCVPTQRVAAGLDADELAFGDFTAGRWAWKLENITPLRAAIPARGSRGLWDWEPPPGCVLPGRPLLERGWLQTTLV